MREKWPEIWKPMSGGSIGGGRSGTYRMQMSGGPQAARMTRGKRRRLGATGTFLARSMCSIIVEHFHFFGSKKTFWSSEVRFI